MKIPVANISQRKITRVTGIAILIRLLVGPYVFFLLDSLFGDSTFVIPGDAAIKAANNIKANEWLFSIFITCILSMITCSVVVSLALYILLKPVNKDLILLTLGFRLMSAIIFAISMVFLFIQPTSFTYVFLIGQIINALGNVVLGYLIIKSGYIPKILGVLMIIGGSLGYLMESLTYFFFPNHVWISVPGIMIAVITEISLCFWFLLKSDKIPEMKPEVNKL